MSKKLSIMSLSIEPEMQDELKKYAKEEGVSVSKLLRDLVEKYLVNRDKFTIIEHNDEFIPVVLKVPSDLRGDPKVKDWVQSRCDAVVQKLSNGNS